MISAYNNIVIVCSYNLIVALIAKVKHLNYLKICKKLGPNHLYKKKKIVVLKVAQKMIDYPSHSR